MGLRQHNMHFFKKSWSKAVHNKISAHTTAGRARGGHTGGAAATLPARVQTRSCAIRLVMQPAEVL